MKVGVAHKLFLAILTAAVLSVFSSVVIMQWNISRGFLKFINSVEQSGVSRLAGKLEEFYRFEQNWDLLRNDPARWNHLIAVSVPEVGPPHGNHLPDNPPPEERIPDGPPPNHIPGENHGPMPPRISHNFDQRLYLLDSSKNVLIKNAKVTVDTTVAPLLYQGRVVGYLGLSPRQIIADAPQQRFLREQKLALGLTAGVVVLLASALSLLLARRLVKPIQELTHATHQLAAGSFAVRVSAASHDELGQLARDFNALALTLEQGELTRRQWVADISHELRTPLSILRGEIEALQDGIRQPTTDKINSLHSEVMHLVRLVDDLYQLSLSDVGALTYRKSELDLASVLKETVMLFRSDFLSKNISLELKIPENGGVSFFGDSERLHQLFSNLLDNSLKYTNSGGSLQVALYVDNSKVTIDFIDSVPNVPEAELDRLFERLYRVESSRNRLTGGAGLGLAICRNIVTAHNGSITAQASPMGGLWIRIELPGGKTAIVEQQSVVAATPSCPSGTYNAALHLCEQAPICSQGTFNTSVGKCEYPSTTTQPATATTTPQMTFDIPVYDGDYVYLSSLYGYKGLLGYISSKSFTGSKITYKDPTTLSTTNYGYGIAGYVSSTSTSIPHPIGLYGYPLFRSSGTTLYGYISRDAGTFGGTIYSCTTGTLQGSNCIVPTTAQADPTCPTGTYDATSKVCQSSPALTCSSGFTLSNGQCQGVLVPAGFDTAVDHLLAAGSYCYDAGDGTFTYHHPFAVQ